MQHRGRMISSEESIVMKRYEIRRTKERRTSHLVHKHEVIQEKSNYTALQAVHKFCLMETETWVFQAKKLLDQIFI